jgi:3-isopropylmalate/(R)-2-methylmalate dehydratase small subunit
MDPVHAHTGRMVPLARSDVDTDQIIPSDYCRRLSRTGFVDGLFAGWRADPAFVLNDPVRRGASVLVGQSNFGTGSSREPAVWALKEWGFAAIIAESFGDIFRRNALANGLLAVELEEAAVTALREEARTDPDAEITVDLRTCTVSARPGVWSFEVPDRARWLLLNGLDEIGVTLGRDEAITTFEAARAPWLPARLAAGAPGRAGR